MEVLVSGGPRLITVGPLTSSQSVTIPFGVSNLVTVSGKGQDGTPDTPSTRTSNVQGDTVQAFSSGSGPISGALTWNSFQSDITSIFNNVNAGGSGSEFVAVYTGYPNTNTYSSTLLQNGYSNAVPGTASVFLSPGWKTSGTILADDYGYFLITYTENYTIPATTGANTTGFGQTFAGGIGGPAATQNFTNVAVSGGASYNLIVPSGGSITITYYQ